MQMTIQKIAEAIQSGDHAKTLGHDLAMAMARDGVSYSQAHERIMHMMKVLECAKNYISEAAFYELKKDNRKIDASIMQHIAESYE